MNWLDQSDTPNTTLETNQNQDRTSPVNTPSDFSVGKVVKMESTTVSRQINILKKKNKENVQPAQVVKSFIKQNASKAAPGPQLSVKPSTSSHPPNTFYSARPPARSVPTTVRPKMATVAQSRRCGTMIVKPKDPVIVKKASKPPVTSTISQYRTHGETAEEKKAKLAEWLAVKGKTLKRPAMSAAPATNGKVSYKSAPPPKSQLSTRSKSAAEVKQASVPPALTADNQETDKRTSLIMNTTLDLLENSVLDQPQDSDSDRVDDIVLNLCDALEALEPPSRSDDQLPQMNECNDEYNECKQEDIKNETADEIVKSEGSSSDEQDVIEESEESDDDYVKENTSPMKEASVVKYSIKTTPFLQSVKKTIEDDVCISTSKKKSNIKDLKFLTPVRRSSRIHRQSSRLPAMLADHDPCVSSLAELVKLDDDANAYIYRKNPALLEDLPDQPRP
uniref:Cytoskeleton-associated protein 2 C-terminal domain-containing protein n=1 Tax=Knipowitschia caucasica TaxID=637954 RepID=A0AAV2J8Y8_KNICA